MSSSGRRGGARKVDVCAGLGWAGLCTAGCLDGGCRLLESKRRALQPPAHPPEVDRRQAHQLQRHPEHGVDLAVVRVVVVVGQPQPRPPRGAQVGQGQRVAQHLGGSGGGGEAGACAGEACRQLMMRGVALRTVARRPGVHAAARGKRHMASGGPPAGGWCVPHLVQGGQPDAKQPAHRCQEAAAKDGAARQQLALVGHLPAQ